MNLEAIESLSEEQKLDLFEFLLWHYRVVDSFWFIYVNEQFDQQVAETINEQVWGKVAGMAAKDLVKRFGIQERGLKGFLEAYRLYPWSMLIEYEFEVSDEAIILSTPCCPTQAARLKRGLGEYACKEMHRGEFEGFAKAIDERIEVECIFAPPDPHPPDMHCKWKFYLRESAK